MYILPFVIATILVGITSARISNRIFPYQPLQSLLSFLSLFWVIVTALQLVMGVAGFLSPIALLASCVAFSLGEWLWSSRRPVFARESQKEPIVLLSSLGIGVTIAIGFLSLLPLSGLLGEVWSQVRSVQPLSWDVVSYHLPNAVTYLQARSWLLIQGTYGHYPGGNELLNLWSMMFLTNESLLGLTTLTLVLGSLLATTVIFNLVVPIRSVFFRGLFSLGVMLGLLNLSEFQNLFFDIARNDSTMMFWELVALWAFLKSKTRVENWSIVTGVAIGMLIGTKPNGLYFLIAALILNLVFSNSELEESLADRIKGSLLKILLPSLAIGGGWYARNLIQTGQLTPPDQLKAAADLSIIQNLTNQALYTFNFPFTIMLVATIVSIIPLIISILQRTQSSKNPPSIPMTNRSVPLGIQIVAAWNLIAIGALILTPSGAGYLAGAGKVFLIQVRYSAVIMPLTLILVGYALAFLLEPLLQPKPWLDSLERRSPPIAAKLPLLLTSCIALLLVLLQSTTYRSPQGLPGHDGILFPGGQQQSKVYAWVQENVKNSVIYSVGLRPYGLVGEDFSNRVIDRLGSEGWTLAEGLPIMDKNKVKYLVLCVDPFARSVPSGLKEMLNQPKFQLVFKDDLAVVFKVN
jgi:hypothetical protein